MAFPNGSSQMLPTKKYTLEKLLFSSVEKINYKNLTKSPKKMSKQFSAQDAVYRFSRGASNTELMGKETFSPWLLRYIRGVTRQSASEILGIRQCVDKQTKRQKPLYWKELSLKPV